MLYCNCKAYNNDRLWDEDGRMGSGDRKSFSGFYQNKRRQDAGTSRNRHKRAIFY